MEGAAPDPTGDRAGVVASRFSTRSLDDVIDAAKHFCRRSAGERQKQDAARIRAARDEPRHAMGQRGRFTRACSGDNQQGPVRMTGGGPLLLIQFGQNGIGFVGNRHWRGSSLEFHSIRPIAPPP
jgi:hypothetical protein